MPVRWEIHATMFLRTIYSTVCFVSKVVPEAMEMPSHASPA